MSQTVQNQAAPPAVPKTIKEAFALAVERHRADDFDEAARLYRLCLANQPNGAVTWTNFGALLRKQQKYAAAIACHRKSLQLDPGNVNARSNLANALADNGQCEESIELREQLCANFRMNGHGFGIWLSLTGAAGVTRTLLIW